MCLFLTIDLCITVCLAVCHCVDVGLSVCLCAVVMRVQGSLRVVLNTMIWPNMLVERSSKRSVRISAVDADDGIKIYLIQVRCGLPDTGEVRCDLPDTGEMCVMQVRCE